MTSTNLLQFAGVRETTLGTTPTTPRMRAARITGESLVLKPEMVMSEEIRSDGMDADPIKVGESNSGGVNFEQIYPMPNTLLSSIFESIFGAPWSQTPERDNDGTADSVITDIGTTANTLVCTTGTAFVVGHLVRLSGNAQAANNGLFPVTTGGATSFVSTGSGFVAEAAPPAASRAKVVGFQGVSGDITATATGLASTTLNFTTFGLTTGRWLKIGGTGAAFRFANETLNAWVRVAGTPTATAIPLDNLPVGWTTDAGTGKTMRVFFGDQLKNGVTVLGQTLERGFLGQAAPSYVAQAGMVGNTGEWNFTTRQKVTMTASFLGMSAPPPGTTPLDASVDAAPAVGSFPIMAASANLGRIAENGAVLTAPNWVQSIRLSVNNNLRGITAADSMNVVDIRRGTQEVAATVQTMFGDLALYNKVMAMTPTNLNWRVAKNSQALVWGLPRVTPVDGTPNAPARNQDAMIPLSLRASADTATAAHLILDRFEFFQD